MQPKYLNTLYLYLPLNTLIYLNKRLFSLFLKMPPGYRGLQGVTGSYKRLQGVTDGYKGLQGVTRGYDG